MKRTAITALSVIVGLSAVFGTISYPRTGAAYAQQSASRKAPTTTEQALTKRLKRSEQLAKQAQAALDAGDLPAATRYATARLQNTKKTDWDYGNVIYESNQILGLAALKQGNVAKAKSYLLAAGRTPGSAVLNSFGPEMKLAQALFKKGEKKAVSDFLTLIARFWAVPPPGTPKRFDSTYATHARMIARWQSEIKAGKTPSLERFDFDVAEGSRSEIPELLATGTTAPDFAATDKDGKEVKLSDFKGKVVVVDFWASWCPPCVASMPHNQSVAKKLQAEGLPVVLLAVDNSEDRAPFLKWVAAHPEMDAVLFAHADPKNGDIAGKSYNVSGIPTQYVIDGTGVIRQSFVGFGGPNDDLEKAVRAANGTAPSALTP